MSRAQILILALLVLHLLLGALCIVISRGEHKSSALRWWGWGLLTYATGLLVAMTFLLGVPRPIAFTVGIGIVTFAPVLCAHGVLAHTPFRLDAAWVGIGVLVVLVLLVGANFLGYRTALVNLTAPTLLAIVLFTIAARSIVTRGPRDARAANQFLGAILALGVVTWVARFFTLIAALDGTNDIERLDLIVSLFSVAQMVNGVAATLSLVWIDVRLMQAELSRVAHTDALTGLPNRRAVRVRFGEESSRAARHGQHFALAVFDIDHFKQVNDRYGHAVGDEMLKAVAAAFSSDKRGEDVLGRIGGEEFLMLVAQQSIDGAREAADRLRAAAGSVHIDVGAEKVRVTVSAGVALYPDDGQDWEHLFAVADRRLYAAKRGGRNRVEASG
ncbi:MAG: GGDEF domain-containing protein [Usitatibacter sp.]